jgi:hypothetical protein
VAVLVRAGGSLGDSFGCPGGRFFGSPVALSALTQQRAAAGIALESAWNRMDLVVKW